MLVIDIDFDFPPGLHLSSWFSPSVLPRLSVSQVGVTVLRYQMITNQICQLYSQFTSRFVKIQYQLKLKVRGFQVIFRRPLWYLIIPECLNDWMIVFASDQKYVSQKYGQNFFWKISTGCSLVIVFYNIGCGIIYNIFHILHPHSVDT